MPRTTWASIEGLSLDFTVIMLNPVPLYSSRAFIYVAATGIIRPNPQPGKGADLSAELLGGAYCRDEGPGVPQTSATAHLAQLSEALEEVDALRVSVRSRDAALKNQVPTNRSAETYRVRDESRASVIGGARASTGARGTMCGKFPRRRNFT